MADRNQIEGGHVQYNDEAAYDSDTSGSAASETSSASELPPVLDESFLPRLLALFFAIFHPTEGPKVVYQVPEGCVTAQEVGDTKAKGQRCKAPQTPATEDIPSDAFLEQEQLFDFDNLSDYLIPKAALCGRLITCTTRGLKNAQSGSSESRHRSNRSRSRTRLPPKATLSYQDRQYKVVSHPMLLQDAQKYERNTFIFNLAFVFDGKADVKSYEPVVRKCARALRDLEVRTDRSHTG